VLASCRIFPIDHQWGSYKVVRCVAGVSISTKGRTCVFQVQENLSCSCISKKGHTRIDQFLLRRIPAFLRSDLLLDSSDLERGYVSHSLHVALESITSSLALAADMHTPEKAYAAYVFGGPGKAQEKGRSPYPRAQPR
jgi:hypothetical protein